MKLYSDLKTIKFAILLGAVSPRSNGPQYCSIYFKLFIMICTFQNCFARRSHMQILSPEKQKHKFKKMKQFRFVPFKILKLFNFYCELIKFNSEL